MKNPTDENYAKLRKVVDELENEHNHAGNIIKELRKVTNDFTPQKELAALIDLFTIALKR